MSKIYFRHFLFFFAFRQYDLKSIKKIKMKCFINLNKLGTYKNIYIKIKIFY